MKAEGLEIGMIRPQTLFPFPEHAIHEAAVKPSCSHVVSIELNMGQMVEDVDRCVKGQRPVTWYGEAGGDVPSPEEIIDHVKSLLKE
jgi:2-oxoglutarate ferredoxin oxidoreductase subunit alpha